MKIRENYRTLNIHSLNNAVFIIAAVMLFSCNGYAQFHHKLWKSDNGKILEKQTEYWENGNRKFENIRIGDRISRNQYFENGTTALIAEIDQYFLNDTVTTYDPETYEAEYQIVKGVRDRLNGSYQLFHANGSLAEVGKTKKGVKVGEWKYYYESAKYEKGVLFKNLTYDAQGLLTGLYQEFHPNSELKVEGKYSVVTEETIQEGLNIETNETIMMKETIVKEVKIGKWKYFNEKGELVETKEAH